LDATQKRKTQNQAANKAVIPIPLVDIDVDEDVDLSEQDLEILGSASFLETLDYGAIARYEP
jgi:nucleolar complex protein 3